jgi:hypothetical protein
MQDVEPLTGSENFSFMLGIARAATSEFVELSRRNPGKFSYGSPGIGSTMHFAGELARQQAGLFITHIPYRGVSTLTSDLVGNVVEFAFMSPTGRGPPRSERPAGRPGSLGATTACPAADPGGGRTPRAQRL